MRTRVHAEDRWFSLCIRERSNWTCDRCHKQFPENAQNLHASHFVSRRKRATRWDPENVFAHCFVCHQYLGENPGEFMLWVRDNYRERGRKDDNGPYALIQRGNQTLKATAKDRERIANHYRQEYRRMKELRDEGQTGRIEILNWQDTAPQEAKKKQSPLGKIR